uniref:Ig-like domain-containing protein n=1 Tax=Monopterus albus TaxID=43700 RepID=A0A3Q3JZ34_MONAL
GVWLFEGSVIMVIYPGGYMIIDNWMNRTTFQLKSYESCLHLCLLDKWLLSLSAVPISNVTMTAKATNLVEFNDTAVLMCSVSTGTPLSYTWRNGSSAVTAGGDVQLSNGNATLTLVNVTRYDTGPFYCFVFNGVSNGSSSLYIFLYGPSNPAMMVMPMTSRYSYRTGSNITLSCSADSSPSAIISWMLNNVSLNHIDPQFQLQNATRNNSGTYKCLFYNTVTLRVIRIWVIANPSIFNKPFNLTCVVTESVDTILWWKDGQLISASNTTIIGADNKTLELSPVRRSDNGSYWCEAFNAVSNRTSSPYNVIVDYGPDIPTITGPNVAKTGDSVTLTCYASSDPPSFYTWYFGGSLVANTSNYVTPPLTTNMSGVYTCMAYNNVTGQNTTANATLTVIFSLLPDPIQNVQIAAPTNPAIAGYSYNLTCEVTGPADHVYWMMADMPLYADNAITYSTDNKTITFNPIRVSDTGRYQCMAMNAVGNRTSHDYMFVVNYGPQMPIITGPQFAESGQSAQFNCSAMSQPPSQYSWWFNNMTVANTSDLTIQNLSSTMSGKYTCMAYNNVTGNYSSNYTMLTVIRKKI